MRRIVAYEGRRTSDNRIIKEGALYVREAIIPVRDYDGNLIGLADDFRRDEEGRVSFEIDVIKNGENTVKDCSATVSLNPYVENIRRDGVIEVESARIREVAYSIGFNAWGE